jgi:hypothetical protein
MPYYIHKKTGSESTAVCTRLPKPRLPPTNG